MSPLMAAMVSRMAGPPVLLGSPGTHETLSTFTTKNLPGSTLVILRATVSYNRDLSLGLWRKIPTVTF